MQKFKNIRVIASLPTRERGLKCKLVKNDDGFEESLPTRGAWIEINLNKVFGYQEAVAPHTGSVD